jgi:hypothetical protein
VFQSQQISPCNPFPTTTITLKIDFYPFKKISNSARAMHVFLRKKQNQRLCVLLKLKQHEQLTLVSHNLCFSIYLSCHLGTKVTK